jgi:hypothetical protein
MKFMITAYDLQEGEVAELSNLLKAYVSALESPEPAPEAKQKPVTEPVPEKTIYELLKEKTLEAFSLGIKPKVIQLYEEFGIKVLTELKNEQYADYLEKIKKLVAEETVFK